MNRDRVERTAAFRPTPKKTQRRKDRTNPKLCMVYGLHGSDNVIRYIGQTRQMADDRLKMHRTIAKRNKLPLHKWILATGDDLKMKILCRHATWDITEIIMIDRCKQAGGELFNLTRGGEDTHLETRRCAQYVYPW